jgi:pimeloyl-ACP methyl ester carboxylesterase
MAGNEALSARNRNSADEFYTQLPDIEAELRHYRDHFKGKVVLCNCDDPYESNFFKYFAMNFNHLGLKKLIATSYSGSPITGGQLSLFDVEGLRATRPVRDMYKVEVTEVSDLNADGAIDLLDVEHLLRHDATVVTPLEGDGDFRSPECVALLDEADIVVANPPWSLIRSYIPLLLEHGKQFLVLGDQNFITYREIFEEIRANNLWFGYNNGGTKWFRVPDDYEIKTESRQLHLENVILIGHSMAGNISLEAALNNDKVLAVVGVDNFKDVAGAYSDEMKTRVADFIHQLRIDFDATAEAYVTRALFQPTTDSAVVRRVLRGVQDVDSAVAAETMAGVFEYAPKAGERLAQLRKRLYLINSSARPTNAAELRATGVTVTVLEVGPTGHYPMLEDPQAFDSRLRQVLRDVETAGRK